jgi:hypothetical protein
MTWTYSQSTGHLSQNTVAVGRGYSGTGAGRDNGTMQAVPNVGPIPVGRYRIGRSHDTATHGPVVMQLTPRLGTQTFGRQGFLIHGDNRRHDASHGCIVIDRRFRDQIARSGDDELQVVP